jgi:hypothetical protein
MFHIFQMMLTITIHGDKKRGCDMTDASLQGAPIPAINFVMHNLYLGG